jgi:hypothetical protein
LENTLSIACYIGNDSPPQRQPLPRQDGSKEGIGAGDACAKGYVHEHGNKVQFT